MECEICFENYTIFVEYECKHKVCFKCGTRLFVLYKNFECSFCKTDTKTIYVKDFSGPFELCKDGNILYQNRYCKKVVTQILSSACKKCKKVFANCTELEQHYKTEHFIVLCNECQTNKKLFWFEYDLYTSETLIQHKQGRLNENGFKGHIYCVFCKVYLYDEAFAKSHCQQTHVICSICDILGYKYRYYNTLSDLSKHYKNAHYCCTNTFCVNIKAFVFPYKTELLEHLIKYHKQNALFQDLRSGVCDILYMNPFNNSRVTSKVLNPKASFINQNAVQLNKINKSDKIADQHNTIISDKLKKKGSNNFSVRQKSILSSSSAFPDYLQTSRINELKKEQNIRMSTIKRLVNGNLDMVYDCIEKMVHREIGVNEGFLELKNLIDGRTLLKLIKDIRFGDAEGAVREEYKRLEEDVLFPRFTKGKPDPKFKKPDASVGYKILDLNKYKQK